MYYKVWRKNETTHFWSFFSFRDESKARLIHFTKNQTPQINYYESENQISHELFEKYDLNYVVVMSIPNN